MNPPTINNKPVEEIVKDRLKYTPASNYPTKLRDIAPGLLRTNNSTIAIEFIRNNEKMNQTLKTFSLTEINLTNKSQVADSCFKMIDKECVTKSGQ